MDDAKAKAWEVLASLSLGAGPLTDRVHAAYVYHLIHVVHEDMGLPTDLRAALNQIDATLTRHEGTHGEGSVRASLDRAEPAEIEAVARRIYDWCFSVIEQSN